MLTNKELRQAIRNLLKEKGIKRNDVSVRVSGGYSSAVNITVKNPKISRRQVEQIVKDYQNVERDERTGEILGGANTYIFVEYAADVFNDVMKAWLVTAESAMKDKAEVIRIFNGLYLTRDYERHKWIVRQQNDKDFCKSYASEIEDIAKLIYKFVEFGSIAA